MSQGNAAYRERHLVRGLCNDCSEPVVRKRRFCAKHLLAYKARVNKRTARIKAAGECTRCRSRLPFERRGLTLCVACIERARVEKQARLDHVRLAVLNLLGGQCACVRDDCFHAGQCPVADQRILTIDHVDKDGAFFRHVQRSHVLRWEAHLRAAISGSPRLQVLCPNCHFLKDVPRGAIPIKRLAAVNS